MIEEHFKGVILRDYISKDGHNFYGHDNLIIRDDPKGFSYIFGITLFIAGLVVTYNPSYRVLIVIIWIMLSIIGCIFLAFSAYGRIFILKVGIMHARELVYPFGRFNISNYPWGNIINIDLRNGLEILYKNNEFKSQRLLLINKLSKDNAKGSADYLRVLQRDGKIPVNVAIFD